MKWGNAAAWNEVTAVGSDEGMRPMKGRDTSLPRLWSTTKESVCWGQHADNVQTASRPPARTRPHADASVRGVTHKT